MNFLAGVNNVGSVETMLVIVMSVFPNQRNSPGKITRGRLCACTKVCSTMSKLLR